LLIKTACKNFVVITFASHHTCKGKPTEAYNIDYEALYRQSESLNHSLQVQVLQLQQQLSQLQKMIFSSGHERFEVNPSQLSLDIQADQTATCSIADTKKIAYTRTSVSAEQKPLVHPGRMKLPEQLRREEVTIEPTEDSVGLKKIGKEITEVLEYRPVSCLMFERIKLER
jgi:transposase